MKNKIMKKLSLYIFLVLMWCNISFAETKDSMTCEIQFGKSLPAKAKVSFKKINDKWAIEIDRNIWVDNEEKDDIGAVTTVSVTEHDAELLWYHEEMDTKFHVLIDRDEGIMHTNDIRYGKREWICN
jgi:hypothetical protein